MKEIKHIFFDLDHTLWDFEANSKKTYEFIFLQNGISLDIEVFLEKYIPINHHYWKLYREEKVTKKQLRYSRLKDAFDQANFAISDSMIYKLADEYIANLSNYNQLFPSVIEVLEYLKPKYDLHIITNGFAEIQQTKLNKSDISKYFNKIITSESVGVKKPNPKVFYHALDVAKAKTYQSIMIGDNIEADIYGAKNIGMRTIFFNPEKQPVPSGIISINNLKQIKKIL
jgi:putative hydrolase of the HAD superfamily